jgi:hypothetical protein
MNPPSTLREILQAEITWLEEMAGQLNGLDDLKLGVAEDKEYPPHKCHAIGVLMAKKVLEVTLSARTKDEQIALMRHYVLEFGQTMSRNARLSNSLADNDPRKEEVDDEGARPASWYPPSTASSVTSQPSPHSIYRQVLLRTQ